MRLAAGREFPSVTSVVPGSGQVIHFVAAAESKGRRKGVRDAASEKAKEAKERARQEWDNAMAQLKTPVRVHRLTRYAEGQLPVHAQYIPAGTVYFAELAQPLDFGSEVITPEMATSMGGAVPPGSVVQCTVNHSPLFGDCPEG